MTKRKANTGFTLLELMIVLAIIAIGAAVAGFSIKGMMPDIRLSAAARDLKSDLNFARLKALRENRAVWIQFKPEEGRYDVLLDDGDSSFDEALETILKTVYVPDGITLSDAGFAFGKTQTRFDYRGLALAGTVSFANTGGKQRDVKVAKTGRVSIIKS